MTHFINILYTRTILLGLLTMLTIRADSQSVAESQHIEVTFNKTSSIIFPAGITGVDRGSRDVLAQKAKGVDNVLQIKAARINFKETNLTVITADGILHHFFVRYADQPVVFAIQAASPGKAVDSSPQFPLLFHSEMTDAEMSRHAESILSSPRKLPLKSTSKYSMRVSLQGIYISGNIMFYHIRIVNRSNIPYHTAMLRFYVKDRQKVRRTASQELSKVPLYHYGNAHVIEGKSSQDLVYALPKFTIPDVKVLTIELVEEQGGRHLQLAVGNRTIVNARPVKEN